MKNKCVRWCAAVGVAFVSAGWIIPLAGAANFFST